MTSWVSNADATVEEARAAWRRLVRESHPDRMIARGLPEEAVPHRRTSAHRRQPRLGGDQRGPRRLMRIATWNIELFTELFDDDRQHPRRRGIGVRPLRRYTRGAGPRPSPRS